MIEILPESKDNILAFRASDKLTDSDYKNVLIPNLNKIISTHGKVKVIFDMGSDFHGWEAKAVWDDMTFGLQHKNDFEKCAVVGGPKWVEWASKLGSHIMSGEVKTFSADQLDTAWQWIKS